MNKLIFGDNLLWLKEFAKVFPQGFIDLVYIDPPFNSKRNYNILFEAIELTNTKAQREAFSDTWSNVTYLDTLQELKELHLELYELLHTLDNLDAISKGAVSYLTTMAIRIFYIHKLLKDTGSFYLHCDPTMNHYLKIICDLIFGKKNFRNEIIWQRTHHPKGSQFKDKKYGIYTDIILFYTKTNNYYFDLDRIRKKLSVSEIKEKYPKSDVRGKYLEYPIIRSKSKGERPNLVYQYKNYTPPKWGWVVSKNKLIEIDERGDLGWRKSGTPFRKYRPHEDRGHPIGNLWVDIHRLSASQAEYLGYPTQKPEALLERIIKASSNEGDVVADFFCGCGTTVAVAERLKRKWFGIDISHLAVKLITKRLLETYGLPIRKTFEIFGFPEDINSAKMLAKETKGGRLKFEEWVVEIKLHGILNANRTQAGYDGHLLFGFDKEKFIALIEVKSGTTSLSQLNHFIQTVEKKNAAMGIFVCFKERITHGMLRAAKEKGIFDKRFKADKIQIFSVEELLEGNYPDIPAPDLLFKKATKKMKDSNTQTKLSF